MKKIYLSSYLYVIGWLLALLVVGLLLLICEPDLLWKIQERNLFFCSLLYLKEQLLVPGGLLTWVGMWFTSFLYYPIVGVLMLCCWWLLLMFVIKRAFCIANRWAILMLIPVALLLLTNMDMGYWIYMLKLRGHFFISTIGTTVVAALLWGFRLLPAKYGVRTAYIVLTALVGYLLMGIYGLAASLVMGVWSWRLSANRKDAVIQSIVALLAIVAVPLFCYRYVYYQVNLANIYWAELPIYFITEEHHAYYISYYLLLLFFVVAAATYRVDGESTAPAKRSVPYMISQVVIMVALVVGVYHFWMKDENFHRELAMQHCVSKCDWTGVLKVAADQDDEPTRAVVMLRNLALSRLGRQGDEMFLYKNGSKAYAAPFAMRLMLVEGPLIYYQYGLLNDCNRLCMEMGVEFGFRIEDYKLLVNCAILEGDRPLARKYIGLLKQTLFYRDWAEQAEALLEHPDRIAQDPEREPITHMLHYPNVLGSDQGYTERYVMRNLVNSPYKGDPIFQEQCLLATLWTKNMEQFWYHFYDYVELHPNGRMPRYYQEAAYLYGRIQERSDLDRMPFDKGIKDSYETFMTNAMNYNNQEASVVRQGLYPFFGETYYLDYYTMRNMPEY